MKINKALFAAAIVLATVSVAGCTVNIDNSNGQHGGMMHQDNESEFSSSDVMFAQMMIPHHQQAVDMGTLAETRAKDPEVKDLAAQIKAEQAPEIKQMKLWLDSANAGMDMGHEMGMDGMLSKEEMVALENSSGLEFDRLYVAGMIAHHEGAVEMASMVLMSDNAEAKQLGEAIVSSQTKQIETLKAILKRLG